MNEYRWGKWCPGQVSDTSKVTQSGAEAASDSNSLHCWFCACSLQYSQLSSFTRKGKEFLYGVVLGLLWSSMGWCKSGYPFTVTRIPVAQICLQSHGTTWEPLDCITALHFKGRFHTVPFSFEVHKVWLCYLLSFCLPTLLTTYLYGRLWRHVRISLSTHTPAFTLVISVFLKAPYSLPWFHQFYQYLS